MIKTILELAADERQRQITQLGYTPTHDLTHNNGELVTAALAYATPDSKRTCFDETNKEHWPFEPEAWKPNPEDRERELVKAIALLVAEAERLRAMKVAAANG